MLSYILGFAFPLFAPELSDTFGYGWGIGLLAFVWIAIAFPVPLILWCRGRRLCAIGKRQKVDERVYFQK
jgi:hypothetical protein